MSGQDTLGAVSGVLVAVGEDTGTSAQWITVVATALSRGTAGEPLKKLGTLVPFRILCTKQETSPPLGHRLDATCHFGGPDMDVASMSENTEEIHGIAVRPEYGESITISEKPDFAAMGDILKRSASDEARLLTVKALITLPGDSSSKLLLEALQDSSTDVRLAAAEELVARKYEPAMKQLSALLEQDREAELLYQVGVARIMAAAGHEIGHAFLLRHLDDSSPEVAVAALQAMGEIGTAADVAGLKRIAETTEDEAVAGAAGDAVKAIQERLAGAQ